MESNKKNKGKIWKIVRWPIYLVLSFILYIVLSIVYGTVTDFQPEEEISLKLQKSTANKVITKAELSFLNWNVGYGGLGAKSNFFYDDGRFFFSGDKMVRAPKEYVEENIEGVRQYLENNKTDFVLLQEVDQASKRSYYINQYESYQKVLSDYQSTFAYNFKVARVPLPMCEPWNIMGEMNSGLATYSTYEASSSTRNDYPGDYGWPDKIFHLDRCMAVHRYPTKDNKELIVINTHNSAYDGGTLKAQEMNYFKKFIIDEYEKGNYIIAGGDWNQNPPGVQFGEAAASWGIAIDSSYNPGGITQEFMPSDWTWAYDKTVPTNRKLQNTYQHKKTFVTLIDFYLLSPNVELVKVKGEDLAFEHSDHQPVKMTIRLKGLVADSTSISQ